MKNFSLNQLSTNNRALCIVNHQPNKHCAFKSLKSILTLVTLLIVGTVPTWGSTDITINASTTGIPSAYATAVSVTGYSGSGIMYNAKGTPNNWAVKQVIQFRKSSTTTAAGEFYNTTAITTITSIKVYLVVNDNAFTLNYGDESQSTDYTLTSDATSGVTKTTEQVNYSTSTGSSSTVTANVYTFDVGAASPTYFHIINGASANYVYKIVITYASGPEKLTTPTNLAEESVTENSATLTWTAVTHASSYTVKFGDTEYTGVSTNSYNVSGLSASTQYTWTVKAIGDGTNYSSSDYASNKQFTTSVHVVTWTDYLTECSNEPSISVNPTSVTGLGYVYGSEASASMVKTFTVTGSYLESNKVMITAPTGFEVKTSTGNFADKIELTPTDEAVNETISVRLSSGKTVNTYNGNVTVSCSSAGLGDKTVALTAEVTKAKLTTPSVTATPGVHQITLSWDAVANASSYQLVWDGGSPETINSTSVVKDNLIGGSNHTYSIIAVGSGNYSNSDAAIGNATAGKESFTVTFKNNGVTLLVGGTRNVEEGAEIGALPVLTSADACDETARTFVGWSVQEITEKTVTAPALISATTTVSAAITYNAVWAEGGSDYVKTTADKLVSGGKVVMVHNASGTNYALSSNSSTTNYLNRYSVSITNSTITSPATEIVWNVSISSSSYKFDQGPTKKLNETSSGLYANSTDDSWIITTKNSSYELQGSNNSQYIDYWGSDGFTKYANSHADNTIDFYVPSNTNFITKCPTTGYVTYNANDATSGSVPVDATEYTFGTTVTVKTNSGNLTKDHYDFAGWNTKADGTGDTYSAVAPLGTFTITKNTTLYAKWTPKTYQVTWSINGDDTDKTDVVYNNKVSAMHADPAASACDGKVFRGWVTTPIDGEQADAPSGMFTDVAGSPTITDNITFYAVFAASSGSGTVFEDALNISGTNSVSSRTGWSAFNQAYGGSGSIRLASGNNAGYMTTNALSTMSGTATISFKIKGYAGNELGPMTLSVENGEEGYVLSQSSFSATSSTDWTDCSCTLAGAGTSAQLDFYATAGNRIYIKDVLVTCGSYSNYSTSCATLYTVTFDGNNGTPAVESVKQTSEGGSVTLTTATRDGYNFNGWWTATSGGTKVGDANASYTPSGNETVHAQWTPISYNITYTNTKGQSTSGYPTSYTIESATINFAALSNVTGYTFSAWSPASIASGSTGDKTIEAQWTTNTHSLTWVTDGDALTGEYTHGDAIAYGTAIVAPNTPTKTGYTFKAWDPAVAATMPDNDVTYTATWTPNPNTAYTVNHYKQNLDGTYPAEAFATDNLTGTTGASVTPDVKTGDAITGFTAPSTQTVTILADGSRVVTYNYTRNTYTLTWALAGGEITTPGTAAGLVKYGAELTAPTVTKAGSTFKGWTPNVPATMPADNVTYTATWSTNDNFHNGETIFFRSQGSDNQSAWWYGACVKAWFHNTSSEAASTAWLNDGSGYKMFYTIVPATGDFSELQVQRFADNCSDWWGEAGDLTQSGRNGKNTIASWRTTDPETFHAAWHDDIYALKVRGSIDSWAADQISLTDAGAGVFTGSMSHKAIANTSEEFRVRDSEGVYFGTDGNSNNNTTLSGMTIGSTYTINASFALATRVLTITKTITAATISFDMQGHGTQVAALADQPVGQPITAPATPTATGYEFTGWYTDPSCTQAWNFSDPITESMTLYAGWLSTTFVNYRTSCMIKVKTPVISPAAGSYECAQNITIECATADAAIYYTTDGSNPTTSSSVYTIPFSLPSSATVKAIAVKDGMTDSEIASAEYTIITQCPAPTIETAEQYFDEYVDVTISSSFAGGTIYYTTDGSNPTTSSSVYSTPIHITATTTVKAMVAKGSCLLNSEIVSAAYTKNPRYTVTWMVNGASYSAGTPTTEVIENHKVTTLPTAPAHSTLVDDCASEANHFMGWSVTNVGETPTTDPGNIFTDAEHSPSITGATTFYAVFAKETSGKGPDIVITPNFNQTPAPYGLPTSATSTTTKYFMERDSFTIGGTHTYASYQTTYWLQLEVNTSKSAYIQFPAIENYKLTHATAVVKTNSSTNANVSICPTNSTSAISGGTSTAVSSPMDKTWDLSGTSTNTAYRLYVAGTNSTSKNIQFTSISLTYESEGGVSTYSGYVTACAACEHRITITKGTPENGTFDLTLKGNQCIDTEWPTGTSTTLTATPDPHYYLSGVNVSGDGATSATVGEISDNTCTISTITGDITITPEFTQASAHTISWKVNGADAASGSQTTSLYEGDEFSTMTLPIAPDNDELHDACGSNARKFVGWSTTNVGWNTGGTVPSVLFTSNTEAGTKLGKMGKEDVIFYAVFAEEVVEATTWEEFVADGSMTTCDFVIAAINDNKYYSFAIPTSSSTQTPIDISSYVNNGTISATNASAYKLTFAKTTNGYSIKGGTKYFGYDSGNKTTININATFTASTREYSVNNGSCGTYRITNVSETSRHICYNGTYFGHYVTSNICSGSYKDSEILPIASGTPTYQNYVTECCPAVSAPTNLNATPAVGGGTVYWTKSDNATAYEIQVNGGAWTNVGDVNSYTISGIACGGTAVNWNIRALNNCYTSTHANSSFYTASCNCDGFQFHYRDFSGNWNTNNVCFSAVAGTEHDQLTDEFALPYANAFNVTWQGSPLSDNKTKTTDFQYMGYFLQNSKNFGVNPQNGNMGGALGKMHIYDNSGAENMYVQWIPTGYTLQMGDGSNWPTTYYFMGKTSAWNETEWFTDLMTVTNDQIGGKIYVGLKTQNGYVWCNTYSESINLNGLRTKTGAGDNWLTNGLSTAYANKTGKFRIYANSADKNWYVTFVPHLQLTYNANGGSGEMEPSAWHSVEETDEQRTITVAANGFTAPSGKAFRGWNKSADGTGDWINVDSDWVLRENISNVLYAIWENSYPVRYTGTTTGDIDHYAAEGATEHIKPDPVEQGYTFTGWTVTKDGGGTVEVSGTSNNYTFTMPTDGVTIHANMTAGLVNLNYFDMGGTSCTAENIGTMPETHTYGKPTILPAGVKIGYRFEGWHLQSDCSDAAIAELAANVDYANPLAIYAKWTQVQTISFFENGVERTELAQQAGAGESVTMPASSGIGCGDYQTFLGWVVGTVDETTTVPANIYEAASSFTATGEAVTFHALYTKIVNGDPDKGALGNIYYEKVTSGVTDGAYILVSSHAESPYYYTGQHEASTSTTNYGTVSNANLTKSGDIVSTPLPASCQLVSVTIGTGANAGKFAMSNGDGYFTATSGNYFNNNISSLANAFVWNLTAGEQVNSKDCPAGAIHSTDYSLRVLQYNGTGGGRFACYENTQSTYVNLYRATENGTRYYSTTADMKYTWHSGDDNTEVVRLGCLEVFTPATPVACDGKTFMGWSKTAVSATQSTPIDLVDFSTYTPVGDDEFWAVYATQNGGKLGVEMTKTENFNNLSSADKITFNDGDAHKDFSTEYARYVCSGEGANTKLMVRTISSVDYALINFDVRTSSASVTTFKIKNLKALKFDTRTGSASTYTVSVSKDNLSWTTIKTGSFSNTNHLVDCGTLSEVDDYYVKVEAAVGTVSTTSNRWAGITEFQFTTQDKSYFYADYSTNCDKSSANMTFDPGDGATGSVDPITTVGWVTIPEATGLKKNCDIFAGWQVTGVAGYTETFQPGEQFLLNSNVLMTAQWTANSCSEGSLDATADYITSTNGVAKKSVLHTLTISSINGETVTPVLSGTDAERFAITDAVLDLTSDVKTYTFRVQYTAAAASTANSATLNFEDATGHRFTDTSGADLEMTLNARSVADQIVLAAKVGAQWYALPANMLAADIHLGIPITVDNADNPTIANTVSVGAVYTLNALDSKSESDPSRVRFASTLDSKALWGSSSNNAIKNYAAITGTSAKGDAYDWILTTTDLQSYTIRNNRGGSPRNLSVNTDHKWGLHGTSFASADIRILAVGTQLTYIPMTVQSWQDEGFTFTTTVEIPTYSSINVVYGGSNFVATMTDASPYVITIPGINFDEHSGEALTVEWFSSDNKVAMGAVNTPIFIKSDTTLTDYDPEYLATTDVHVLNGGKISVAENCTIHNLFVEGGGTVVQTAGTFSMNELSLKGGWVNNDKEKFDMPRLYLTSPAFFKTTQTTVNMDITVDNNNFYPFAVPFEVPVSSINYVDPVLHDAAKYNKHFVIKTYDGAARAERGENTDNWVVVPSTATLKPGVGYIIRAVTPAGYDPRIRVPMTVVNGWTADGELSVIDGKQRRDTVGVTAHTGAKAEEHKRHAGWNFVANPYLSCFSGAGASGDFIGGKIVIKDGKFGYEDEVPYVTVPVHNFSEYLQITLEEAKLRPEWSFFVQAGTTGTMSFANEGRVDNDSTSPVWVVKRSAEPVRKLKANLVLTHQSKSDKTGLVISNRYTSAYEIGADLEKMFGDGYTLATYTITDGVRHAFNALSENEAQQTIPVGFRAPEAGEYTFSLDPRYDMSNFERLDLIDYQTGELTNLLIGSYTFTASKEQNDERFAINAVLRKMPTDIRDIGVDADSGPQKIIYEEHFYIINHDDVFNGSGQRVK